MSVVVIGLNHRTAPLDLLERMTVGDGQLPKALHDLTTRPNISEALVLSTCNRTEVYAVAERFHGAYSDIRGFLADFSFLPPEEFSDHLYVHYDSAAAQHLMAVTAGLDSAVLGESEIQGQIKVAWERARDDGAAGPALNLLMRHALEAGKRARTETGIARSVASVSQAAVAMADQRLDGIAGARVLVLGAGEMGEGMAVALAGAGASEVAVANRTSRRAYDLAARVGGRAVPLLDVPDELGRVDVLLTSTGSKAPLIEKDDVAPVMAGTRRAPPARRRHRGAPRCRPRGGRDRRRHAARHGRRAGLRGRRAWPSAASRSRRSRPSSPTSSSATSSPRPPARWRR